MKVLAERQGRRVIEFDPSHETLRPGLRYLGIVSTHDPLIHHVVAIDERGIVFDPDPAKGESRQHWLMYEFKAGLGFERVSALEQLASESAPNVPEEGR